MLRRWSSEHGKYCSFLSMKLYSLHRATLLCRLIVGAPLIFRPAKDEKILGVFNFLAPVKHWTSLLPPCGVAHHEFKSVFLMDRIRISFRKSVNSTLFLTACKTKIADDPFLRAFSSFCLFSRLNISPLPGATQKPTCWSALLRNRLLNAF